MVLSEILNNKVLICAALSWLTAQALKVLLTLWMEKRLDWRHAQRS